MEENIINLAPLNYDRFFKKVFSDLRIAKRFLEDFLDITIETIEFLPTKKNITDDSQFVEFDFRCQIDNNYIIIEMQQWYKPDVVQRFFVYHALGSALQLETMPKKLIPTLDGKTRSVHDYRELIPTITIVWMVHDCMGFEQDYVSYILTPEYIREFVEDGNNWNTKRLDEILEKRKQILKMINNSYDELDFFVKNKLIYVFQKNIVNNNVYSKYFNWFELAEKTLKKIHDKFAYNAYLKDEILTEVIRRLTQEMQESESETYIKNYEDSLDGVRRYENGVHKKMEHRVKWELKIEYEEKVNQAEENEKLAKELANQAIENEKKAIENEKLAIENEKLAKTEIFQRKLNMAKKMKKYGESIEEIINETGLTEDEINKIN